MKAQKCILVSSQNRSNMTKYEEDFKYLQLVMIRDVPILTSQRKMDLHGRFVRHLRHMPQYRGKCMVLINGVQFIVKLEQIEVLDPKYEWEQSK